MEIPDIFLLVPSWDRWIVAESQAWCGVRDSRVRDHVHVRVHARGYDCGGDDGHVRDHASA